MIEFIINYVRPRPYMRTNFRSVFFFTSIRFNRIFFCRFYLRAGELKRKISKSCFEIREPPIDLFYHGVITKNTFTFVIRNSEGVTTEFCDWYRNRNRRHGNNIMKTDIQKLLSNGVVSSVVQRPPFISLTK